MRAAARALRPLLALALAAACASWRPLAPAAWSDADAHRDVFRTRLRVTRLDGRRFYLERPEWTPAALRGVYPAGWPPVAPADSSIVIPRDSIARLERLESNRLRTAAYLATLGALAVALLRR